MNAISVRHMTPEQYFKQQAKWRVNDAIKAGKMVRGTVCEMASRECKGRIEGHHQDYSKPLDVQWLCARHHRILHRDCSATVTLPPLTRRQRREHKERWSANSWEGK